MLEGEVSQDCRGRGPPLWAWWPALWTELLEALTPVGCGTTSTVEPASLCDQKQNGGSLQMEVWSLCAEGVWGSQFQDCPRSLFSGSSIRLPWSLWSSPRGGRESCL